MSGRLNAAAVVACALLSLAPTMARATLTISSAPTSNMSCTNLACVATAADATLNVGDLTSRLASRNFKVATTGAGADAGDIEIEVALGWSSPRVLTLNTHESIRIDQPVSVVGTGGLSLILDQGDLSFGPSGRVKFWDHASALTINGHAYTLIGNVADLATAIAASPSAFFALADNYDASGDTLTHGAAVPYFTGGFEGLGNSISNLTLSCIDCSTGTQFGLFGRMIGGSAENLGLANVTIDVGVSQAMAGALAGEAQNATFRGDFATGSLTGSGMVTVGGLVGTLSYGSAVIRSHSAVAITTNNTAGSTIFAGGLVGACGQDSAAGRTTVSLSYATGNVTMLSTGFHVGGGLVSEIGNCEINESFANGAVSGEGNAVLGGLASYPTSTAMQVSNSYATGAVSGGQDARIGGLLGGNRGKIATSYAVGQVSLAAGTTGYTGGLISNQDGIPPDIRRAVWDIQTTRQNSCIATGGAQPAGCKGLKTRRLKASLVSGFKPAIWALDPAKNDGFPYLVNNPPPQ